MPKNIKKSSKNGEDRVTVFKSYKKQKLLRQVGFIAAAIIVAV
jgi:hypothetical protein